MKKTIDDIDVRGQRVLVRLDLNVPIDSQGLITDDLRIQAALPTIRTLIKGSGRLILMSHLGRPEGDPDARKKYSLAPVSQWLSKLIDKPVLLAGDCIGDSAREAAAGLRDGDVCLLENLRFHEAEQIKDKDAARTPALRDKKVAFAHQLADLADVYVNDAFGTCHRDNASMLTVPQLMVGKPRVVGYLVQRELKFLGAVISHPERPFVCIVGGVKVSDKLKVIQALLGKCDTILIGGAMAYTFLAAKGIGVGKSLVELDLIETAGLLIKEAGDRLQLPIDSIVADRIALGVTTEVCENVIPVDRLGLDIGPKTVQRYAAILKRAKTILWNGPMGVFETPPFDRGTVAIARALAEVTDKGAVTIVGGGDSAAAVDRAGLADRMTHISTGGGASLEFLEGKRFAPIEVLDEAT